MEFSKLNGYDVKDKKAIRYYDTVADMKADTTLKVGMHIKTKGYYTPNDGGQGEYFIENNNELVSDNGSVHTLTNGLKAILNESNINVKHFGAKGDGITDDSTAIQTCINNSDIVNLTEGEYLIGTTLNLKNNLKILGNKATFKLNSEIECFKYDPTPATKSLYKYTITGNEPSTTLFLTINDTHYSVTLPSVNEDDIIYIVPDFNSCVWINALKTKEHEYELGNLSTGVDITNDSLVNNVTLPSTYLENVTIKDIEFDYPNINNTKYPIYIRFGKNITIENCKTKNSSLAWIGLNISPSSYSTTNDSYIESGFSSKILNDNININNCVITGPKVNEYSDILIETSGIYIQHCKNVNCNNNNISYLWHGISIWGGNVGPNNYCEYEMLRFCNNINTCNNIIYCIRYGGIWSSRASKQIINNNNIDICGDVNIDIEGGENSTVDGNVSNNSRNGNLAVFYSAKDVVFSNNTCKDENILECRHMFYYNDNVTNHICNIIVTGNTFFSQEIVKGATLIGALRGKILFTSNTFTNCGIYKVQLSSPLVEIKDNIFKCFDNIDLTNFESFINLLGDNRSGGPEAIIKDNTFDVSAPNGTNYGYSNNNANFDGKYAIQFTNGAHGFHPHIVVENNRIYGFNKSILLNHQAPSGDNVGTYHMYMFRNIISGPVHNISDTRGYIVYDNNKSLYNGDNVTFKRPMVNYPNAIPTDDTHGGWVVGTRIYFDTPSSGYTGAICTATGSPGTWKKFGQIES